MILNRGLWLGKRRKWTEGDEQLHVRSFDCISGLETKSRVVFLVIADTTNRCMCILSKEKRGVLEGENEATAHTRLCMGAAENEHSSLGRYCQSIISNMPFTVATHSSCSTFLRQRFISSLCYLCVALFGFSHCQNSCSRLKSQHSPSMPGERNRRRQSSSSPPRPLP